jgi:hypothetical protein
MKNYFILGLTIFFAIPNLLSQSITRKALFLGNSYTSTNNLPQETANIATNMGDNLIFDHHTPGGYKLSQHYLDPISKSKIQSNTWDFVILQEQSQIPSSSPFNFIANVGNLNTFIKQNVPCALTMLYMTWGRKNGDAANCPTNPPVCTYIGMDAITRTSYMTQAQLHSAEVTPVGAAWRYVRLNHPSVNLYQPDDSHPTPEGTYLAACCFYTTLFRKDPSFITYNSSISSSDASIIRSAVKAVVYDSLSTWYINAYNPLANFSLTIGPGINTVGLLNQSTHADTYFWNYGDGNTSTSTTYSINHSYTTNGTYTISLTASKCFLGQTHSNTYQKVISFCAHTPTILPLQVLTCPGPPVMLWTQQFDTYQWFENGILLPGATGNSHFGNVGDAYSVIATLNGCSELSEERFVDTYVGIPNPCSPLSIDQEAESAMSKVRVRPNPSSHFFILSVPEHLLGKTYQVVDVLGKVVEKNILSEAEYKLKTENLVSGIYFLQIENMPSIKLVRH